MILEMLVGIPLSIFSNLSSDKLSSFISRHKFLESGLDDLFMKAFFESIKRHNRHHDEVSKGALSELKKRIQGDKNRFLQIFCGTKTIRKLSDEKFLKELAKTIAKEYGINDEKLLQYIVTDCLHDYTRCFFAHISEKEFMSIMLADLFDLEDSLKDAHTVLSRIDERTAWIDFYYFKNNIFARHIKTDADYQKILSEYDQFVISRYDDLQLRGFTPKIGDMVVALGLDEIFVPLELNEEKSADCDCLPRIYDEPDPLLRNQRSVLLGKPGSGKSTLLKHIAVNISKNRKSSVETAKNIVPILFKVSEYAEANKAKPPVNLHDFLCSRIEAKYRDFIDATLLRSDALILIDGLDEVTDKALRIKVTERIEEFICAYPRCQCIVTSRITGYSEARLRASFTHFQLADFTEAQIKQFSVNWISAIHKGREREKIVKEAEELFSSIRQNDSVFKLATNPLLMTIIAMIYHKNIRLPNSRIALYEYSTDTFLESWVRLRVNSDSQLKSKDEIIEILRPIAYYIHKEKSDACIGEKELFDIFMHYYKTFHSETSNEMVKKETREFIDFLREQAGFFYEVGIKNGEKIFSFMHLTFEEYFAGLHVAIDFNDGGKLWTDAIYKSRWTEILRLSASCLGPKISRNTATKFVESIMNAPDDFPELGRKESLLCQLFSDDIAVNDECTGKFLKMVTDHFTSEWAQITVDKGDFRALFRSNIGKKFWSYCFSTVKSMDDEKLRQGILLDIILDNQAVALDGVEISAKQYLTEVNHSTFKNIAERSFSFDSSYNDSLYAIIENRVFSQIKSFSSDDLSIPVNYMFGTQRRSETRRSGPVHYNHLKNMEMLKKLIRNVKENPLQHTKFLNLCLVHFVSFWPRPTNDFTELITNELFSEDDGAFVKKFINERDKHNTSLSSFSRYMENSDSQWFIRGASTSMDERVFFNVMNADARDQWHFEYPVNEKQSQGDLLLCFPINIQKEILAFCLGFNKLSSEKNASLLKRLKSLNIDLESCWSWGDYIMEHVNEDCVFDPLFIVAYERLIRSMRIGTGRRNLDRDSLKALKMPFLYEPSFPLSALIKLAKKEPISKELLLNIRDYALNSTGLLRKESLRTLKYLVDKELS